MSVSQTHGYHLVLEIDGNRVGRILDDFIPNPIDFSIGTLTAHAASIVGRPSTVTISNGNALTIVAARSVQIFTSTFNVRVTIQAVVNTNASGQILITYPSQPTIVADTPADQTTLQNLANTANVIFGTTYTVAQVLQMGAAQLLTTLQSGFSLPTIPIGVNFSTGACPLSLSRIDLHSIPGSLFILLKFAGSGIPASTPNAAAFTSSLRGANHAVMLIGNEALLSIAACFISHAPSPLAGTTFATSGTCTTLITPHVVSLDGHDIMVSALSVCVSGNHLVVAGGASTSGTGWSASASFSAPLGFDCHADGTVFPIFDPNNVAINIDISFDWWMYVLGFALAAVAGIFLGPIAAIVLSIVVASLSAIASMIANAIARNALSGLSDSLNSAVASGFRMLPAQLLQILGDLQCQQVILDDFSLMGTTSNPNGPSIMLNETHEVQTNSVQTGSGGSGLNQYIDYNVANSVTYATTGYNFKAPATTTWHLNNTAISGSGNLNMNGKTVHYTVTNSTVVLDTALGDNVTGVLSVKIAGADNYAKTATIIVDIKGSYRDYPEQDAIQAIMNKVSHMVYVQGLPFPGPGPDPAEREIDLQESFTNAALTNSMASKITGTAEFNKQMAGIQAIQL